MGQQVIVTVTDDLDGSAADETVRFGLDGAGYEIDLSAKDPPLCGRPWASTWLRPEANAGQPEARAAPVRPAPGRPTRRPFVSGPRNRDLR